MAGQGLKTLALETQGRAVPSAAQTRSGFWGTLTQMLPWLCQQRWNLWQVLSGVWHWEEGMGELVVCTRVQGRIFCARLFLAVKLSVIRFSSKRERIVWNHIKRGLPSGQGQQRLYEQMPYSLERTGWVFRTFFQSIQLKAAASQPMHLYNDRASQCHIYFFKISWQSGSLKLIHLMRLQRVNTLVSSLWLKNSRNGS